MHCQNHFKWYIDFLRCSLITNFKNVFLETIKIKKITHRKYFKCLFYVFFWFTIEFSFLVLNKYYFVHCKKSFMLQVLNQTENGKIFLGKICPDCGKIDFQFPTFSQQMRKFWQGGEISPLFCIVSGKVKVFNSFV